MKIKMILAFVVGLCFMVLQSCNHKNKPIYDADNHYSLYINDIKIDSDINRIFYGVSVDGESLKFKKLPQLISFRNETIEDISPFIFTVKVQSFHPVKISHFYKIEEEWETQLDSLTKEYNYILNLGDYMLFPYENIPFPLTEVNFGKKNNIINMDFQYGINPQSHKEVIINLFAFPNVKSGQKANIEKYFLYYIQQLIKGTRKMTSTIVFDSILVSRLDDNQLLNNNISDIESLKKQIE